MSAGAMELLAEVVFSTHEGNAGVPSLGLRFCPLGDEDITIKGCRPIAEVAASTTQQTLELKVVICTVSTSPGENQLHRSAGRVRSPKVTGFHFSGWQALCLLS